MGLYALFLLFVSDPPDKSFAIEAYGEILYSQYDYGPNQRATPTGSIDEHRGEFDIPRFVMEFAYHFNDRFEVEAEIEYEHGGTGSALELEYEEFGEYETEVEKGGEIVLEKFVLARHFDSGAEFQIGRVYVPFGWISVEDDPLHYMTATRPETETSLIPTVWHEMGARFDFSRYGLDASIAIVNGLDSTGFDSKFWIRNGHQRKFETVRATDLAITGRVDLPLGGDSVVGISGYFGNTTGNRPKNDMEGIDGCLAMGELHGRAHFGRFAVRGLGIFGQLQNAHLITAKNQRLSTEIQTARTPVARQAYSWFVEPSYRVWEKEARRLDAFAHIGQVDSMADTHPTIFAAARYDRRIAALGLNYWPTEHIVTKLEFARRSFVDDRLNIENTIQLSAGFAGDWF